MVSVGLFAVDYPIGWGGRATRMRSMCRPGERMPVLLKSPVTRAPCWRISDTRVRCSIPADPFRQWRFPKTEVAPPRTPW